MMTEDELKELEKGLRDSDGIFFDHMMWLADNQPRLMALIAEVRRLNAAYARFLKDYEVDLEHIRTHYDKFATEIEVVDIFEPERFED